MTHAVFHRNLFFVKEHAGLFKAANNFDVYDPQTQQKILECRENKLGFFTKLFRFTEYKRMTPFHVEISQPGGPTLIAVKRNFSWLKFEVLVLDGHGKILCKFIRKKIFSLGGTFAAVDIHDRPLFTIKGKWTGWNFHFTHEGQDLAHITKKWAGVGKELFTSADNYMLEIFAAVPADSPLRPLLLAAVICMDMIRHE